MRDQIATSLTFEPDDFAYAPSLGSPKLGKGGSQRGGLGKAHQLFGDQLTKLLDELNRQLVA